MTSSFVVGMPHMVPGQLSEVELLKILGARQWHAIAAALDVPTKAIVNDGGERLYASFVGIDVSLGDRSLFDFEEGVTATIHHEVRCYARRFVEGVLRFGVSAEPREGGPRVVMTNAFVTREHSNLRLRTFAPQAEWAPGTAASERPAGLLDHDRAQRGGGIDVPGWERARALAGLAPTPIIYPILPESDLNGAGLLYFARYVAMMNYGERRLLREHATVPVSAGLLRRLSTERRRLFYFANAAETDSVDIRINVRAETSDEAADTWVSPLKLYFETDLYRSSDGVLMAKGIVRKGLRLPRKAKSLLYEAQRLVSLWDL